MSVINRTPFPALAFRQYNLAGNMNGVVVAQGTFLLVEDGPMETAPDQLPLQMTDAFAGEPLLTSMTAQTALVPFKPGADVTFLGHALAPGGRATTDWECAIRVGDVGKRLRVTGPRNWVAQLAVEDVGILRTRFEKRIVGWKLTAPAPVTEVELDWSLAASDLARDRDPDLDRDVNAQNPLGFGWLSRPPESVDAVFPAPQIEDPGRPLRAPGDAQIPEGFGYVSPWWRTRLKHAGTYDDVWLHNRHPLLPADFDFSFWQCAHPDLISRRWFMGDEAFELENLVHGYPRLRGFLPGVGLRMRIARDGRYGVTDMVLDGVHFDLRPGKAHAVLTWRAGFPWPDGAGQPEIAGFALNVEAS